jgi:hypothetical protein
LNDFLGHITSGPPVWAFQAKFSTGRLPTESMMARRIRRIFSGNSIPIVPTGVDLQKVHCPMLVAHRTKASSPPEFPDAPQRCRREQDKAGIGGVAKRISKHGSRAAFPLVSPTRLRQCCAAAGRYRPERIWPDEP